MIIKLQGDMANVNSKLDLIMAHLQIASPPPSPPEAQDILRD